MFTNKFIEIIKDEVTKAGHDIDKDTVTLNFRDSSYSPERGGFHPVEIMIEKGEVLYVTDFCYFGPFDELVKDLDWDFALGRFQQLGVGDSREYRVQLSTIKLWMGEDVKYTPYSLGMVNY